MLTAFVVLQLVFDVVLVLFWAAGAARRRAARGGAAPPDWYPQFVALAQEVLAVTEPVLDALETKLPAPAPAPIPAPAPAPVRLLPGELALLRNLAAAAAERRPPGAG